MTGNPARAARGGTASQPAELYRREVEALEAALRDPTSAAAATEALRTLINAIRVFPGEERGEVTVPAAP